MPKVDRVKLADKLFESSKPEEFGKIVGYILKSDNSIRATKPALEKYGPDINWYTKSKAMYVWRMVVFCVSQKRSHQCMPVCADFDLPAQDNQGKWSCSIARDMAKELKELEDIILDCIDKREWHGINRWGRALGYING